MSFLLSEGEKITPLWVRIERQLNERLNQLRVLNDREQTEAQTAKTRGQIAEVKAMLAWANERPIID